MDNKTIEIFPAFNNINSDDNLWLNKFNISCLINRLNNVDGFVITPDSCFSLDSPFEFNLAGYFIRLDNLRSIEISDLSPIKFEFDNDKIIASVITRDYASLILDDRLFKLTLVEKVDNKWVIPQSSRVQINAAELLKAIEENQSIDDGIIE